MNITQSQKKQFRTIGHSLKPVVLIGGKGITESIIKEIDRALEDHELIKVKLSGGSKEERRKSAEEINEQMESSTVQMTGNILLIYRPAKNPNPKLSNILKATK